MGNWTELSKQLENTLRLRTKVIAFRKLDDSTELDKIPGVRRFDQRFTFCQLPTLVRRGGQTVGVTRDNLGERCARINGLAPTTEEAIEREATNFATHTWFANIEEARKQMAVYPLIPPGEAVVLAPLATGKFDPTVKVPEADEW